MYWAFTYWNYDAGTFDYLEKTRHFIGLVYQEELCPRTKRKHLQGAFALARPYGKREILKCLKAPNDFGIRICEGSWMHNVLYCSNPLKRLPGGHHFASHVWDDSSHPLCGLGQGGRSDLKIICEILKKDRDLRRIVLEYPTQFVRYSRGIQQLLLHYELLDPVSRGKPVIEIFWGPTGSGKSKKAMDEHPLAYLLGAGSSGTTWFSSYCGQTTCLVDEYTGWIPYEELLKLLDWHRTLVHTKGGAAYLKVCHWIFTSNLHPRDWYPDAPNDALERRIWEFGTVTRIDAPTGKRPFRSVWDSDVRGDRGTYVPGHRLGPGARRAAPPWDGPAGSYLDSYIESGPAAACS